MLETVLGIISQFAITVIKTGGYAGITFLMALESANIPIPSEIIMPFSGFIAQSGGFNFIAIVIFGTIGNVLGSVISYCLGYYGGRPFFEKYGKYFFVTKKELNTADFWFNKHGLKAVFWGRLLPVVRTFISLPAGITKMDFKKFILYSFLGCAPWCFVLAYLGFLLGERWSMLEIYFKKFDILIVLAVIIGIGWFIYEKYNLKVNSDINKA